MDLFQQIYSWPSKSLGFASTNSTNCGSETVYLTPGWESEDADGQLYALFYAIYYKGLEHLGIWNLKGKGWNQSPTYTEGWLYTVVKIRGSQNSHVQFWLHRGLVALTPMLFKIQLYLFFCNSVVWVPYIFWIFTPYQIYGLQMASLIL